MGEVGHKGAPMFLVKGLEGSIIHRMLLLSTRLARYLVLNVEGIFKAENQVKGHGLSV